MYKRGGRGEDEREGEDVGLWCRIYMSTGVHVVEIRYGLRKNQFGRFVLWGFALGRAGQLAAGPCLAVRGGARVAAVGGGGGAREAGKHWIRQSYCTLRPDIKVIQCTAREYRACFRSERHIWKTSQTLGHTFIFLDLF